MFRKLFIFKVFRQKNEAIHKILLEKTKKQKNNISKSFESLIIHNQL